jgi:non-specific serine/threonine protein kinase
VPGEQGYRVPSLSAPDPRQLPSVESAVGYEAIRLFVERAQERRDDFVLSGHNVQGVAEICARLDGVPLAIELAAARIRSLGVEAIAARLDQSLHLLTGGPRTAPTRQQTLRGALVWSWALLGDHEQALLRRLAVFAGGWTLGAAEEVCTGEGLDTWAVLDALDGLVRKSLTREGQGEEDERRYGLLEPVRQYAAEQLALAEEDGSVRERHLRWALAMAERAAEALTGPEQGAWLARLEAEHDNLRAALAWSLRGGFAGLGLQLAGALWRFWVMRGYVTEGRRWLEQVLSHGDAASAPMSLRARAHNGAGNLAWWQGDFARAHAQLVEALALRRTLGDKVGIAGALNNLGIVAYLRGDLAQALAQCEESLGIFRALGDRWGSATSLHNLGLVMQEQGAFAQAQALHTESLALRRALGDRQGIANSLGGLADVAYLQDNVVGAQPVYEESLALFRELGDTQGVVASLASLGNVNLRQGAYARARDLLEESLALLREIRDDSRLAATLEGFARLAGAQGQPVRGAQLWGAVDALRQVVGKPRPPSEQGIYDQDITTVRGALGTAAFERAWAAGGALPLDEAIALALDDGDPAQGS